MIKILLVGDHPIILEGIASLLSGKDNLNVIATVSNAKESLKILENEKVDIVITDINISGVTLIKKIREEHIDIKIIVLTISQNINTIRKSIEAGAHGYVLKIDPPTELFNAIEEVFNGEDYFSKTVVGIMISDMRSLKTKIKITKRELEILELITKGMTGKEIADYLFISPSTVETHRRNLIEKTGVSNSKALIKYAIDNGFFVNF